MTDNSFIIGNGPSRANLDVSPLFALGTVYGCNAAYRDFTPDYLVAVDRKMQHEILDSGYMHPVLFRQTKDQKLSAPNVTFFTKEFCAPPNSGVGAIYHALKTEGMKNIYLIGFDFKHPGDDKVKNVYSGTQNYEKHGSTPPKLQMKVIDKIAEWAERNHHLLNFIRVIDPDTCWVPKGYDKYIQHITYEEFKNVSN